MPSRKIARKLALQADRRRNAIIRTGVKSAAGIGGKLRREVLKRFRSGTVRNREIIEQAVSGIAEELMKASAVAHLRGYIDVFRRANKTTSQTINLSDFDETLQFLTDKAGLSAVERQRLIDAYGPAAVEFGKDVTAELRDRIDNAMIELVRTGELQKQGLKRLGQEFRKAGILPSQPHMLETIFRTQTNIAYSAGQWAATQDPDISEILWGFEYVTVGDDRVRPAHEALDGFRAEKDNPIWNEIWTPNGYNCRCMIVEVYDMNEIATEFPSTTTDDNGNTINVEPDEGFNFNPGLILPRNIQGLIQ